MLKYKIRICFSDKTVVEWSVKDYRVLKGILELIGINGTESIKCVSLFAIKYFDIMNIEENDE